MTARPKSLLCLRVIVSYPRPLCNLSFTPTQHQCPLLHRCILIDHHIHSITPTGSALEAL